MDRLGAVRIDFRRPSPFLMVGLRQQRNFDVRAEPTRFVLDLSLVLAPTRGATGMHLKRSHVC